MGSIARKIPSKPGVKLFEDDEYCMAVDIGQSIDPTAICILQRIKRTEITQKGAETPLPPEYHVRYLKRLPLGLTYVSVVEEVGRLLARPPLNAGCELVIDDTGVGRAVSELFDRAGLKPIKVTITSGERATCTGARTWHVPKGALVSHLDAALHAKEFKFAAELTEAGAMAAELKDFRRSVSQAGRFSWSAREGSHDDLVLSCSLALFFFVGIPKPLPAQSFKYRLT